jgi:hypothetical protein
MQNVDSAVTVSMKRSIFGQRLTSKNDSETPNATYIPSANEVVRKIAEKNGGIAGGHIGDLIGTGAASVLFIGGQYLWDLDESNYQSHLRGFVYGGISIYALKTAFGRNRPGNSHSHQSFPSGHTAITFMTATHLMYAYGWKAAIIAYPVATFVGISRLYDDAHWLSDTVAGAFLGYFVGRATYYNQSVDGTTQYQLMPILTRDISGVSLNVSY